jgi:hypothetical protein
MDPKKILQKDKNSSDNFIIGTVQDFRMPSPSVDCLYPQALIEAQGATHWIRWSESAEMINLLGIPQIGCRALIQLSNTKRPESGLAMRLVGEDESDPNHDKDDRQGLSTSISAGFQQANSTGSSPYGSTRRLGVPGSDTAVIADASQAVLKGGKNNQIVSDAQNGNIITGPISFGCGFAEFRIGGFWTLNPVLQSMIPSTIVTPIPTMLFSLPLGGFGGVRSAIIELSKFLI